MDYFALKCFVEVVRNGSFSKAASKLFRTQPAISSQIKKLEDEL
ncbi:MAG: LysR family transcriptional regulator, partial [Candidatus Aureabacteria bacterium]|nr:LysR family transcriptional regulator [Candidatus Auribacterota bacterium]